MEIKFFLDNKIWFAIIISIVFLVLFIIFLSYNSFFFESRPISRFEKIKPSDVEIDENSVVDLHIKCAFFQVKNNLSDAEIELIENKIEKNFLELCKTQGPQCDVETLVHYFLFKIADDYKVEDIKANETFKNALSFWRKYYEDFGLDENNIYNFMLFISLLDKIKELDSSYAEKYVDKVMSLQIKNKNPLKRTYAIFGKLYGYGRLQFLYEEKEVGTKISASFPEVFYQDCNQVPTNDTIVEMDDPCLAYVYLRLISICKQMDFLEVMKENTDIREAFLSKDYKQIKKIACQFMLS